MIKLKVRDDLIAELRQKIGRIKSAYSQRFGVPLPSDVSSHGLGVDENTIPDHDVRNNDVSYPAYTSRMAQKFDQARQLAQHLDRSRQNLGIADLTVRTPINKATMIRMGMDNTVNSAISSEETVSSPYHNRSIHPSTFSSRVMSGAILTIKYCLDLHVAVSKNASPTLARSQYFNFIFFLCVVACLFL